VWGDWSFFSSHGLVLLVLARRPDLRIREVAEAVGLTERAAQSIVNDLVDGGYVRRIREGRRNKYLVLGDRQLRHPVTQQHRVADLLHDLVEGPLVPPADRPCEAVVLACTDHRYLEPLRSLLAEQGLLDRCELLLWPGGGPAVSGPEGERLLHAIAELLDREGGGRVLMVGHADCPDAATVDPPGAAEGLDRLAAVRRMRRNDAASVRAVAGVEPELWFLDARGAHRLLLKQHDALTGAAR
jgi:hypothetical protein